MKLNRKFVSVAGVAALALTTVGAVGGSAISTAAPAPYKIAFVSSETGPYPRRLRDRCSERKLRSTSRTLLEASTVTSCS